MNPNFVWGGIFAVGTAYELWAIFSKHYPDTLSDSTRRWFRILPHAKSRTGRIVFTGAWLSFSAWFLYHILFQG